MKNLLAAFGLLLTAGAAPAADFPPITDAERALTAVPGEPNAPAVVLFKKAELKMLDYPREVSSYLKVNVRLKILTEEGKDYGEVEIPHSGFYRLKKLQGRTVLPDGREVPLPEDAIFEERRSRSLKTFVTKAVFPAVEVGAILDYAYTVRWDHLFFLEPWYFQSEVPTRLSEITYVKPPNLALKPWVVRTLRRELHNESNKTPRGSEIRLWMEDLPGIPDEPYSFPFSDLSCRSMMIPEAIVVSGGREPLLDSWKGTCELFDDLYKDARRKDRQAKKEAQAIAAGEQSLLDRVAAVHAFVRDEVLTELAVGVGILEDEKVDGVLADRRGTPIAKALLLQSMLEGLKVDSDLVWVVDKSTGRADLSVPNPWWFDAGLVRVTIDREPIYLDPIDRSVGFGRIAPYYEGTEGVVFGNKPEIVQLPAGSFDDNLRRATVDLEVDEEGRVEGSGSLELEGHQAWQFLRFRDDAEATAEAWTEYLEERFEGYEIAGVEVEEDVRGQHLRVGWSLRQRDEEVLGDEVSLQPSAPLGPVSQPFHLAREQRLTPVQMLYGKRDDLTMTLEWPPGWVLDVAPQEARHAGPPGQVEYRVTVDREARRVTVERRFDLIQNELIGGEAYAALRTLYDQAAKSDAQGLVLVRD